MIAVGGSFSVFLWSQEATRIYQNKSEERIEESLEYSSASFAIYNVTEHRVVVKNIGKVGLKADSFSLYINQSKAVITNNPTGEIQPGENVSLEVSTDLKSKTYIIKVTGQYGLLDETISTTW